MLNQAVKNTIVYSTAKAPTHYVKSFSVAHGTEWTTEESEAVLMTSEKANHAVKFLTMRHVQDCFTAVVD